MSILWGTLGSKIKCTLYANDYFNKQFKTFVYFSDKKGYISEQVLSVPRKDRQLGMASNKGNHHLQHQEEPAICCLYELCYWVSENFIC